jgi:hypothetical protein
MAQFIRLWRQFPLTMIVTASNNRIDVQGRNHKIFCQIAGKASRELAKANCRED